ncbi:unnamed protein product [Rotaria sp. Silwood2]|nr:unnamed protein product [Rotaria sp. Silwood2]CAF2799554.1 unnamed protein product [Rotaria sp. Silwood2]CAF3088484.1 unnamed protein product [Rotaria sp. Silwood2]CAF3331577.1 unnamed protein product [Rotaria sp. Silwood2]CAF4191256.1 unnamed protein product [Rotaria sp. Silwood2]
MYPNLKTLDLAHIYCNLKVHKPEISVRSVLASINAPARQISSFLDELLTPIYNYAAKDITFILQCQSLEYLDVTIENNNGHFKTSIYNKSACEPYILPYESDHSRHVHLNIIYNALLQAAHLCSTVEDFDMERLSTEMILLVNGYPPKFIQQHMKNFFIKYDAMNV